MKQLKQFMENIKQIVAHVFKPRSISMFLIVGLFNTGVGVLLFPFLYWLFGTPETFDFWLQISYLLCTTSSFLLHRYVTFRSVGPFWSEALKYAILSSIIYVLNVIILKLVWPLMPWDKMITQIIIAVALQLGNYFGMNRLVFASLSSIGIFKKWLSPNSRP
jgi:putative flippase GtrA